MVLSPLVNVVWMIARKREMIVSTVESLYKKLIGVMPTLLNRHKNKDRYQKEEGVDELEKEDDFTCNKEGKTLFISLAILVELFLYENFKVSITLSYSLFFIHLIKFRLFGTNHWFFNLFRQLIIYSNLYRK